MKWLFLHRKLYFNELVLDELAALGGYNQCVHLRKVTTMIKNSSDILLSGLTIHGETEILSDGHVLITDGKISEIFSQPADKPSALPAEHLVFPANYHLIPGMIDMHIHGSNGADVMDATPAALDTIRAALLQTGTTGFLATTMTAAVADIEAALKNINDYQQQTTRMAGAEILGIHLEGPFISPAQAGAHVKEFILAPDIDLFEHWQALSGQRIKLVTVAPEQPGAIKFIRHLVQNNVIAAIGHSNASFAMTQTAIDTGATQATHLFNAMSGFHHRHPGCAGALLLDKRIIAELIADGFHLDQAALALALTMKGTQGLVLVTDAMRAQCMSDGSFELGRQQVTVKDQQVRLADGTLAGSVLTMNQALKNMLQFTDKSLHELLPLVCHNPTKALRLFAEQGSITKNKIANLVVLDDELQVKMTFCQGRICFENRSIFPSHSKDVVE